VNECSHSTSYSIGRVVWPKKERATVLSILATAFLHIKEWRCWAMLSAIWPVPLLNACVSAMRLSKILRKWGRNIEITETSFTFPLLYVVPILACNLRLALLDTTFQLVKGWRKEGVKVQRRQAIEARRIVAPKTLCITKPGSVFFLLGLYYIVSMGRKNVWITAVNCWYIFIHYSSLCQYTILICTAKKIVRISSCKKYLGKIVKPQKNTTLLYSTIIWTVSNQFTVLPYNNRYRIDQVRAIYEISDHLLGI
jgi:hypothetical protein